MSWDAVLLRIRGPIRPVEDLADEDYQPLGDPESVATAIRAAFPSARWESPTDACYVLDEYTAVRIELKHIVSSNSLHVTVSGPGDPIPALLALTNANGWVILDCQTTEFINPANPSYEGWSGYNSLRRKALDDIRKAER